MNSSDSKKPTSYLVILFIFPLFYHLPCASSQQEQELGLCKAQFQCGNITAGFPFWGGNRNERCGHPLLELHCNTNTNSTSLFISDQEYYVLVVDQVSFTLRIVRSDLVGPLCSAKFITTTLPLEIFEILPTYTNLTVLYRCDSFYSYPSSDTCPDKGIVSVSQRPEYQTYCNERFTVNVPVSFFQEEEEFSLNRFKSVLREGFEVKVKIDERTCQECSSTGGTCGFNGTIQVCCQTLPSGTSCAPKRQPSADELHRRCSQPFSCGNQNDLLYPFWIPGREECGHPDFRLNCFGGYAELNILSVKFRILDVNYTSRIIRLANSDYISNLCPPNPSNAPFGGNVLLFTPNTELLTIYHGCRDFSFSTPVYDPTYFRELSCDGQNGRSYYVTRNLSSPLLDGVRDLLNKLIVLCLSRASIPASGTALNTLQRNQTSDNLKKALEEGFKLGLNQDCSMCMDSGGACGYNQTSSRFVCYCNNGPYHRTCSSGKSSHGTVIAILIGSLAVALVLLVIFTILFLRKRKTSHEYKQNLKALIPLKQYSYAQVKRITKSFVEVVGKGGFGTVYRGSLSDGSMVAVKVLKDSKVNGGDFINEVASMSKTSHVNIVSLLGFCSQGSKRAIIYEYLENGSLDQFISRNTSMNLDWMTLYGIALGVARGLEYLHYGCKTRIVHFDIKPQNVLLDENLCPRVSDFGLAKLCKKKESTMSMLDMRGTIGYIAPEMISRVYGSVSHKSDVYSYGMLVLEMIGARNQTSTENYASDTSSMYFPDWIYKDLEKGDKWHGITNEEGEIAKKMTLVGLWCIQSWPSDRPSMNKVVEMMEGSLDALEVPPRPVLQQIPAAPIPESSWISEESSRASEIFSKN